MRFDCSSKLFILFFFIELYYCMANSVQKGKNISTAQNVAKDQPYRCRKSVVPPDTHLRYCCTRYVKHYKHYWFSSELHLTEFLTTLRFWNCSNFGDECEKRTFSKFSSFTKLVYDLFCDPQNFIRTCEPKLVNLTRTINFDNKNVSSSVQGSWSNLVSSINSIKLKKDHENDPCVTITLFNRSDGGHGRFHEIIQPFVPFCDIIWNGYDIDSIMAGNISPWTIMRPGCKAGSLIILIIISILCVAVFIANTTVISVYLSTPKLRSSQSIYKISIAIGDFLVGVIVLPCTIAFQYWTFFQPRKMGDVKGYITVGKNDSQKTLELREQRTRNYFLNEKLVMSVGVFTTLSLLVSIYTLLIASFDRYHAVFRPLKYNKQAAQKIAKYACFGLWLLAIMVAILPLFVSDIEYKLVATLLVTTEGETALIFLAILFGIPLLILWIITILTYRAAMKHARNRRKLTGSATSANEMEIKVAKTLALMVLVFSACIFPVFLVFILAHSLDNILFHEPDKLNTSAAATFSSFEYFSTILLLTNSLWNCFIYNTRVNEFQEAQKVTFQKLSKTLRLHYITRGGQYILNSARRFSNAKTSNDSSKIETGNTHLNTQSSSTAPHSSQNNASDTTIDPKPAIKYKTSDIGNEDSTFQSFAIDAGADRLYLSVMDNIENMEGSK